MNNSSRSSSRIATWIVDSKSTAAFGFCEAMKSDDGRKASAPGGIWLYGRPALSFKLNRSR